MFRLEIKTDGEAFQENPALEINARLLEVAARLREDSPPTRGLIRDSNGNTAGTWEYGE